MNFWPQSFRFTLKDHIVQKMVRDSTGMGTLVIDTIETKSRVTWSYSENGEKLTTI